mmetsp:Transcript_19447/g.27284  ORF Transcript_19447/g.27284 Transcript_19447/m.27284 type:complete len:123 (-) Transcript_19447:59-427(-)|eukprot:CAMPEP_0175104368 /NCGR_PEP_ID=MMETSP0086_2-20121207/9690_1 /TAXON_ID=136419 /ORGANISM="Unknown Unknown, Strain D1" /LENGTH=122 /DNA_ID=CAMNT_0016379755 /DNA_START=27 /DNA_END=395 /DNA_ORIENTATION=+
MSSIPGKLGKVAARYPSIASWAQKTHAAETSLNDVRTQIWKLRGEYWYRKISTYPQVMAAARGESKAFFDKVSNPGAWTYKDLATGMVCGTQVFGCFCVGEVLGRGSVFGYDVGADKYNQGH